MLALQASSVLGNGNPDCWIEGYTYQLCCDITKGPKGEAACWDGRFSYETCCLQGIPQTEPALNEWNYQNHDFKGKESAVFRDRALFQGMSECQRRWGWDLNIQWGPPTGVYAEFSGIPLRHLAHGWDGQRHGDVGGCIAFHGRFFLIRGWALTRLRVRRLFEPCRRFFISDFALQRFALRRRWSMTWCLHTHCRSQMRSASR